LQKNVDGVVEEKLENGKKLGTLLNIVGKQESPTNSIRRQTITRA